MKIKKKDVIKPLTLIRNRLQDKYASLSIKKKISYSFISVISLLFIVLIVVVYQVSSNILIEATRKSTLQDIKLVSEKLDIILDEVENYSRSAITNRDIQKTLINKKDNDELSQYSNYIKIRDTLDAVITPRKLVESMIIYDYKNDMYDSGQIQDVKNKGEVKYEASTNLKLPYREWVSTHKSNYILNEEKQNIISFIQRFFNAETAGFLGTIVVNVNEKTISNLYSKIKLGDTGTILFIDDQGIIVSDMDKGKLFSTVDKEPFFSLIKGNNGGATYKLDGIEYLVVYSRYERLNWTIIGVVPTAQLTKHNSILTNRILIIFIIGILISSRLIIFISDTITKPIINLKQTMEHVGEGDLETRAEVINSDEVGALAKAFNGMIYHISDLMENLLNIQKKKKHYELSLLQAQINPHFLYNTLESICGLADLNRNDDIIDLVNELAMFYRGVLSKGSMIISIKDEVDITERYLKILKVRYQDELNYSIQIEEKVLQYSTIKLLLQPIVENSVYHGLRNKKVKGLIEIKGFIEEDRIIICVTDNGIGMKEEDIIQIFSEKESNYKTRSFGLKSADERIKMYFGSQYGLHIRSTYGEQTTVEISLPLNLLWGENSDTDNDY